MRLRERGALSPFPVSERREIAHSERLAVHMGPNMTLEPSRCGVLPAKRFPLPSSRTQLDLHMSVPWRCRATHPPRAHVVCHACRMHPSGGHRPRAYKDGVRVTARTTRAPRQMLMRSKTCPTVPARQGKRRRERDDEPGPNTCRADVVRGEDEGKVR